MPHKEVNVTAEQVRAFWAERQGIPRLVKGGAAAVVRASGWMYSPGSTMPYLAFRARMKKFDRGVVDGALFVEGSLVEIPAVRGCSMLVPPEDVAPAIIGGRRFGVQYLEKVCAACNINHREVQ